MEKSTSHEKQVCRYAAQHFANFRNGGTFTVDSYPDEEERQEPAIDLIGHDSTGSISVEHTRIEPYPQQLRDNSQTRRLFFDFSTRFCNSLETPGRYTLAVKTDGVNRIAGRDQETKLDSLEAWVRAQHLPEPRIPPREQNHVSAGPPDVPIAVTLFRLTAMGDDDGALFVVYSRPSDLEEQRVERIGKAFRDKAKKLEGARQPDGVTLLVLECFDYVMSNPVVIARAVYAAAQHCDAIPDAIICVESSAGEGRWIPYFMKNVSGWSETAMSHAP